MKTYILIILFICPVVVWSQSVGVLGKLSIGHDNPEVELDIRSNTNEVNLNLKPKGLNSTYGYTWSRIKFFTDTITEEGYYIGYFKDPIQFPPFTLREFRITSSNSVGDVNTKMAFGLNYINAGIAGETFNLFSKAVIKNNLELDNNSIVIFDDNSQQSSAAGTMVENGIIRPAETSYKSFMFPKGSSLTPPTAVESTIYYDTVQSELQFFDGSFWKNFQDDNDWSQATNGYANFGSRFVIGGINPSSQRRFSVFSSSEKETGYFRNNGSDVDAGDTYGMRSENYHQTNGTKYGIHGYSSSGGGGQKIGVYGGALSNTGVPHYGGFFEALGSNAVGVYGEASETANANYGGFFKSRGLNGIGVYGEAIGTTASNHGGYFKANGLGGQGVRAEALGVSGTGLYATGSLLAAEFEGAVKATGDVEIHAPVNDAILRMKTTTGTLGRVLQKQNNTEDVYIGDITGTGGDVFIRANGDEKIRVQQDGGITLGNFGISSTANANSIRVKNLEAGNDGPLRADGSGNIYKDDGSSFVSVNAISFTPFNNAPLNNLTTSLAELQIGVNLYAPLNLPDGKEIEALTLRYLDTSPANFRMELVRYHYNTLTENVLEDISTSGNTQTNFETSSILSHIIDNQNNSYFLKCYIINPSMHTSGDLSIRNAKIKFKN